MAEECIAIGRDLIEAKNLLKKDGKLFIEWCNSGECPIGNYGYAKQFIRVGREFGEDGKSISHPGLGIAMLTQLASAKDQVREALLEHIETKQEKGEAVTVKEVFAPLKRQPPGAGA